MDSNTKFIVDSKLLDLECFNMFRKKIGALDLVSVEDIYENCLQKKYSATVYKQYHAIKESLEMYQKVSSKEEICDIMNNTYNGVYMENLDQELETAKDYFAYPSFTFAIQSLNISLNRHKWTHFKKSLSILNLIEPEMSNLVRLNTLYDNIVEYEIEVVKAYELYKVTYDY